MRGVNQAMKQQHIKQFIRTQKFGLVGLFETRVKVHKLGTLYQNVFDGWCFSSNIGCHPGGRIVLDWRPMVFQVQIRVYTSN